MTASHPRGTPAYRGAPGAGATLPAGVLLVAGALLLAPAAAPAQPGPAPEQPAEESGPLLEVSALAGVLAPLTRLTADPETFETEVSSSALLGAEVSWWRTRRFGLTVQAAWAPAQLSLIPTDATGAVPADLGDAEYLAGSAELRYRIPVPPEVDLVRPYVAAGAGVRRLAVEPIASPEVTDATDLMGTAAGGARVDLGSRTSMRFELRDRVTVFHSPTGGDDRVQHDLAITVGLGIGLPGRIRLP